MILNRKEVRRQVRKGWFSRSVAALLLGFDLNLSLVDELVKRRLLTTKTVDGERRLDAHDVLSQAGGDLDTILDRCLPIDRHKRVVARKKFRVLKTATARQCFQRQWSRLHRHVSRLIADVEEDLSSAEIKLMHQLLEAARYYNRFDLSFDSSELQRVTKLDRNSLPLTRRRLEHLGLIESERAGTVGWNIILLDPKTRPPCLRKDPTCSVSTNRTFPGFGCGRLHARQGCSH
jgi:hypothetical protein